MTDSRSSPDIATVTELHKQAASMFLCWPTNAIDLAQKDSDLPQLIDKLAQFIAIWERKGSRATAQCSAGIEGAFDLERAMNLSERVRCALELHEAGCGFTPDPSDVAELLGEYDDLVRGVAQQAPNLGNKNATRRLLRLEQCRVRPNERELQNNPDGYPDEPYETACAAQQAPEPEIDEGRQLCECPRCGRNHWHLGTPPKPKATIEELEAILNSESTEPVEILPDGTVRAVEISSTPRETRSENSREILEVHTIGYRKIRGT